MSLILDALKHSTTLAGITQKALGKKRKDKEASHTVNDDHDAATNATTVSVNRLAGADALHDRIVAVQNKAVQVLRRYSQPFGDEPKWVLLPNMNFERAVGELHPIINVEFRELEAEMSERAEDIVAQSTRGLGKYKGVVPPTVEEIRNGYKLLVEFRPIPESANFTGLPESTIRKLQAMHDAKLEQAVEIAQRNTLERMVDPLGKFIEGMQKYEEKLARQAADPNDNKRDGTFRDTLVTNIRDIWEHLEAFNIKGDPRFDELRTKLEPLATMPPKQLRIDSTIRDAAMERAREVAENLKGWLS